MYILFSLLSLYIEEFVYKLNINPKPYCFQALLLLKTFLISVSQKVKKTLNNFELKTKHIILYNAENIYCPENQDLFLLLFKHILWFRLKKNFFPPQELWTHKGIQWKIYLSWR